MKLFYNILVLCTLSNEYQKFYAQNTNDEFKIYDNHLSEIRTSLSPTQGNTLSLTTPQVSSLSTIILEKIGPQYAQLVAQAIENNEENIDPILIPAPSRHIFKKYIDEYRDKDGQPLVIKAIYKIHTQDYLKFLLHEVHADINQTDAYGSTALFHAYNINITQKLLDAGAHVHHKNQFEETALHHIHNEPITKLLLQYQAQPNAIDFLQKNPLHYCIDISTCNNVLPIAHTLLQAGANVDQQGYNKKTPLHIAMSSQHASIPAIYLLINFGANVTLLDNNNKTALQCANDKSKIRAYHRGLQTIQRKESYCFLQEDYKSQQLRNHEKTKEIPQTLHIQKAPCLAKTPRLSLSTIDIKQALCHYNRKKYLKKNHIGKK